MHAGSCRLVGKGFWTLVYVSWEAWDELEWQGSLFVFVVGAGLWRWDGEIIEFGRIRSKENTAWLTVALLNH